MNEPIPNPLLREQTTDEDTSRPELSENPGKSSSPTSESGSWFWGQSDRGRVRDNNEDQFFLDAERNLFIVADGMGGHAAGEVASLIVVNTLQQMLTPQVIEAAATSSTLQEEFVKALRGANAAVMKASENYRDWNGMGSTAVVALLHNRILTLANVGDSRAYLLRNGALQMLSQDHSVAALLAEQNLISREEVRTHPLRNRLTACLGIEERIQPFASSIPLQPGDRLLLCSDGLWDMLTDQEISELWREFPDAKEAVQVLIAAANRLGGQDNVTVVALDIEHSHKFLTSTEHSEENSSTFLLDDTVVVAC
jgi:serine/threonine protein phosphatase PrpC